MAFILGTWKKRIDVWKATQRSTGIPLRHTVGIYGAFGAAGFIFEANPSQVLLPISLAVGVSMLMKHRHYHRDRAWVLPHTTLKEPCEAAEASMRGVGVIWPQRYRVDAILELGIALYTAWANQELRPEEKAHHCPTLSSGKNATSSYHQGNCSATLLKPEAFDEIGTYLGWNSLVLHEYIYAAYWLSIARSWAREPTLDGHREQLARQRIQDLPAALSLELMGIESGNPASLTSMERWEQRVTKVWDNYPAFQKFREAAIHLSGETLTPSHPLVNAFGVYGMVRQQEFASSYEVSTFEIP